MNSQQFTIQSETLSQFDAIEQLAADAFGPGRFAKSAFRLREGVPHEADLSFVAMEGDKIVGSVRQTRIRIGDKQALVLGPLVVASGVMNNGIGAALMERSMATAKEGPHRLVILVGDESYYAKFGFSQVPFGQIKLPGPADPARILCCELVPDALTEYHGTAEQFIQP
ncbi:MAG: GNAT family N-acetyltransferase [Hyphomicrobiales bacterium]|nr:MAG: GNAT family N-acetyltransferase [Hyphomicrobiales bacterium]